ncbi:MAG: hypothetical protein IJX17_03500 [Clostridia bacterium]|nr:hypothetical protein [Clostridia bacterium]
MTKSEVLKKLQNAMNTVDSYIRKVQAIPGSAKNAECNSYVTRAHSIKADCFRKIKQYQPMDESAVERMNLDFIFKALSDDLKSLELTCNSLVARGEVYTPRDPNKRGPYKRSHNKMKLPSQKKKYLEEPEGPQMG